MEHILHYLASTEIKEQWEPGFHHQQQTQALACQSVSQSGLNDTCTDAACVHRESQASFLNLTTDDRELDQTEEEQQRGSSAVRERQEEDSLKADFSQTAAG